MDELEVWRGGNNCSTTTHFLPEEEPVQEGSFLRADRARLTATSQQQSPIVLSPPPFTWKKAAQVEQMDSGLLFSVSFDEQMKAWEKEKELE